MSELATINVKLVIKTSSNAHKKISYGITAEKDTMG